MEYPAPAAHAVYEINPSEACGEGTMPSWPYYVARWLFREPIDIAITAALAEIGELAAADRAWMFEYDAELLRFRNTHEWSRQGIRSFVEDLQNTSVTMIAWLHQFLVKGQAVMINRVADLPRPARALQVEMLRQNDKSVRFFTRDDCAPALDSMRPRRSDAGRPPTSKRSSNAPS